MAQGRRFTRKTINMSRESFDHCDFIECALICETEQAYLRVRDCHFEACEYIGNGWPDFVREKDRRFHPGSMMQ
jgi:hypothetical protein